MCEQIQTLAIHQKNLKVVSPPLQLPASPINVWSNTASASVGRNSLFFFSLKLLQKGEAVCDQKPWKEPEQRHSVPVWGRPRHTSRQNGDMNLRRNSEKKRLEEDNGLISQKLTVRPAWTVNNLIITDLMPLGLTEIEKATLGWGAVNQLCAPRWIISTPAHAKATSDDRYEFKWQLKGTLRRTHIWLTSPTKWLKNVTFF